MPKTPKYDFEQMLDIAAWDFDELVENSAWNLKSKWNLQAEPIVRSFDILEISHRKMRIEKNFS